MNELLAQAQQALAHGDKAAASRLLRQVVTQEPRNDAAYILDTHPKVEAFAKNAGLGFAVPYLHNGQAHDYLPDFIIRLQGGQMLILETKGYDELAEVKAEAAQRWVSAVNADGHYGQWAYALARKVEEVRKRVEKTF